MSLKINSRFEELTQSEIRNMSIECDRVGGINMSQGICDLELPLPVASAAQEAIRAGENHYTRYDGTQALRSAISKKMQEYNAISADPEKNIIVSSGATGAFYSACLALLNSGDEVILFQPYYGYHVTSLLAANVVPVYATLTPPYWDFDIAELESLITTRTRGILICTPSNPCGKVFSKAELSSLADFASKHNLYIFTDEIYEYFVYDGQKHISPGSIEQTSQQTITISGYSKTFSITGWRIGYAVCQERLAHAIGYISDLIYVCAPAPLQAGVARGINELPPSYYTSLAQSYEVKRNKICSVLDKVGIHPYIPQGAYYVLADVSALPGKTSKEKAMYLLKNVGVATVPGSAFYTGNGGENLVRFCFAKSDDVIESACQRLLQM